MTKRKRFILLGIVIVLAAGTLSHFIYEWTGENFIAGLFTPVNESTWEHMKLVFFPMLLYGVSMEYSLSREYPCLLPALCAGILAGTWLVAILFYSYSGILGFNVFLFDLLVFIASVLTGFWITYRLTRSACCGTLLKFKIPLLILIGIMALCFMVYSYDPPSIGIFREP